MTSERPNPYRVPDKSAKRWIEDINHAIQTGVPSWLKQRLEADIEAIDFFAAEPLVHHECGLSPRELLEGYRNLQTAISDYLERQDDLDNREYHGVNAEPHDTLMRRRNGARDDLDSALAKHKEV